MAIDTLKRLIPNRRSLTRIWLGPFRGARIVMNARNSLRKVFGLYERELNSWLYQALPRVSRVLDVGANDGYFMFGCVAAFQRLGKTTAEIIGFEPEEFHVQALRESLAAQKLTNMKVEIIQSFVGREVQHGMTTLDALPIVDRKHTLVKIDVEGAEVDVLEGARTWLDHTNLFVIEIHDERFLDPLRDMALEYGQQLVQINQRPSRWLRREKRDGFNCWLVSCIH